MGFCNVCKKEYCRAYLKTHWRKCSQNFLIREKKYSAFKAAMLKKRSHPTQSHRPLPKKRHADEEPKIHFFKWLFKPIIGCMFFKKNQIKFYTLENYFFKIIFSKLYKNKIIFKIYKKSSFWYMSSYKFTLGNMALWRNTSEA